MAAHPKASALALLAAAAALSVWPLSTRAALLAWATSLLLSTRRPARRNTGFFSQPTGPSHPASGASVTPPEHALWFNAVLAALWPVCFAPLLCRAALQALNGRLEAAKKPGWLWSLSATRFTLGSAAPWVHDVRCATEPDPCGGGSFVTLRFKLDYETRGDAKLSLDAVLAPAGLHLPLAVTRLRLSGDVALRLSGLSPRFPFVSRLRCACPTAPQLTFALGHAAADQLDVTSLPGLRTWLEAQIGGAVAHLTEPAAKTLSLAARVGDAAPKAQLRVTVHRARGLPPAAGFDPFVRLQLHAQVFETGVRKRWVDPEFGDQSTVLTVLHWDRARLRLDVLGWQPKGPPCRLGSALLDLRCAQLNDGLDTAGTPRAMTLRLAGPGGGGEVDVTLALTDLHRPAQQQAHTPPSLPPPPPDGVVEAPSSGFLSAAAQTRSPSVDAATVEVTSCGEAPILIPTPGDATAQQVVPPPPKPASPPPRPPSSSPPPPPSPPREETAAPPPPPLALVAPHAPHAPSALPPQDGDSSSPMFLSASSTVAAAPRVGVLHVHVWKALGLPSDVLCDPYIRLQLGPTTSDTGVRRRMVDPDFNGQLLRLPLDSWTGGAAVLTVTALGWLPDGVDPVFLGSAQLDVRSLAAGGSLPWVPAAGEEPGSGDVAGAEPPQGASVEVPLLGVPLPGRVNLTLLLRQVTEPPPAEGDAPPTRRAAPPQADTEGRRGAAVGDGEEFIDIELDTPGWALEADAQPQQPTPCPDAAAATASTAGSSSPPAEAAPAPTRAYSAPARRRRDEL